MCPMCKTLTVQHKVLWLTPHQELTPYNAFFKKNKLLKILMRNVNLEAKIMLKMREFGKTVLNFKKKLNLENFE